MDAFDSLLTRRSIRKYTDEKVDEEAINKILKAAMYAPSAFDKQSWQFIVINEKEIIGKTIKAIPHAEEILKQAPVVILICADKEAEETIEFNIQNCSAATQNILLAAHSLGLGTCWIGVYPIKDVMDNLKSLFNLPDHIVPFAAVSIGHPAEKVTAEERFKETKIHLNKW